jgi:hypothetical protein
MLTTNPHTTLTMAMLKFLKHFLFETGGVSADGVASEETHK